MHKQKLGKEGEVLAVEFLQKNNFTILHTNWRYKNLEVDIIAQKNNTIHFIEVKTRQQFQEARDLLTQSKVKNLINAAEYYIQHHETNKEVEFDLITIFKSDNLHKINYISNAFHGSDY